MGLRKVAAAPTEKRGPELELGGEGLGFEGRRRVIGRDEEEFALARSDT